MGDVWIPDRPLTMEELLCIQTLLEEDWRFCSLNDNKRRLKIVLIGVSLTSGFAAGLRGEEIPRIKLGLVRKYWKEAQVCDAPCAVGYGGPVQETRLRKSVFPAFGKRDSIGLTYSEMDVQGNYDLRESWSRQRTHVLVGFLGSRGKSKTMRYGRFESRVSRAVEASTGPLAERHPRERGRGGGIRCSPIRTQGSYRACPKPVHSKGVIEANNRWRKHEKARGMRPGMCMMEHYSDAQASVKMLIRGFSAHQAGVVDRDESEKKERSDGEKTERSDRRNRVRSHRLGRRTAARGSREWREEKENQESREVQICGQKEGIINTHFRDGRPFAFGSREKGKLDQRGGRRAPRQEGCGLAF